MDGKTDTVMDSMSTNIIVKKDRDLWGTHDVRHHIKEEISVLFHRFPRKIKVNSFDK